MTDPRNVSQRPAEPGELCTCGRPAITVYLGGALGPTGYCGIPDGGAKTGPCPFCGGPRHTYGRCPRYRLRPDLDTEPWPPPASEDDDGGPWPYEGDVAGGEAP